MFSTKNTLEYQKGNLRVTDKQKTWLAYFGKILVGSITIEDKVDECELRGFYVDPKFQGKGIGKILLKLALEFAMNKRIVLDTYAHNLKTIEIYKKWGFQIDEKKVYLLVIGQSGQRICILSVCICRMLETSSFRL